MTDDVFRREILDLLISIDHRLEHIETLFRAKMAEKSTQTQPENEKMSKNDKNAPKNAAY